MSSLALARCPKRGSLDPPLHPAEVRRTRGRRCTRVGCEALGDDKRSFDDELVAPSLGSGVLFAALQMPEERGVSSSGWRRGAAASSACLPRIFSFSACLPPRVFSHGVVEPPLVQRFPQMGDLSLSGVTVLLSSAFPANALSCFPTRR